MNIRMKQTMLILFLISLILSFLPILNINADDYLHAGHLDEKYEDIYEAITENDIEAVKDFISNHPGIINKKNDNGMTPLHKAVEQNRMKIVKLLIKEGADVNAKDNADHTPLYYTAFLSKKDGQKITDLLIEKGADVNSTQSSSSDVNSAQSSSSNFEKYKNSVIKINPMQYVAETEYIRTSAKITNEGSNSVTNITITCAWVDQFDKVYMSDSRIIAFLKAGESQDMVFFSMISSNIKNIPSNISDSMVVMIGKNMVNLRSIFIIQYGKKSYLYKK